MSAFSVNAQEKYDPTVIQRNNVKEIEGFILEEGDSLNTYLITKEYFNIRGYRTKIEVYDSIEIKSEYIYNYKDDTLKTERITKFGNKIHSITKLHYDDKLREVKAVDFDSNGNKTGTFSKTKYNDRKRIKENKIYFSNKLAIHTKEQFDKNGSVNKYWTKRNGKWILESMNNGNSDVIVEKIENVFGTELKMTSQTETITKDCTILGLNGKLKLSKEDILRDEKYIKSNGLIEYEKQYLNNKLLSIKRYKYVS